jgi:hypothetical protein
MIVASDKGTGVRAFLCAQSRRPRLRFADAEGTSARCLPAISFRTAD